MLSAVALLGYDVSEVAVEPVLCALVDHVEPTVLSLFGLPVERRAFEALTTVMEVRTRVARAGDYVRGWLPWRSEPLSVWAPFPFCDTARAHFVGLREFRKLDTQVERAALRRAADRVEATLHNSIRIVESSLKGVPLQLTSLAKSDDTACTVNVSSVWYGPVLSGGSNSALLLARLPFSSRLDASNTQSLLPALNAICSPSSNGGFTLPPGSTTIFEAPSPLCFGVRGYYPLGIPPYTPLRLKVTLAGGSEPQGAV